MTTYSQGFKARLVQRMLGREAISATALGREVGIAQPTLSRWARDARRLARMNSQKKDPTPSPRRSWTAEEKLRVVLEAAALSDDELGAFLRREGLHESQLTEWRHCVTTASTEALRNRKKKASTRTPEAKKIRELERELRRKDKALAEVAALLALKKKVQEIWGDEDDDTPTKNGT
jgi:transposase-like protein